MSTEFKKCPNGHWYDPSVYSSCPECEEQNSGMNEIPPTGAAPDFGGNIGSDDIGPTQMSSSIYDDPGDIGETQMAPSGFTEGWNSDDSIESYDKTEPVFINDIKGFNPVVGWLVCVEGSDRGRDYRIVSGYNHIGRSERMDICVQGDLSISREKHAMIAYDDETRLFYFVPGNGKAIAKVNGRPALVPVELSIYDTIKIGSTKLMFVPCCGEKFGWDE